MTGEWRAPETVVFAVESEDRLDKLVSAALEITRTAAAKLIEDGSVSHNGRILKKKSEKPLFLPIYTTILH